MILLSIFSFTLSVLFLVLLIFGLVQCRKHSFAAGFYFFLFLIIGKMYSYLIPPIFSKYIDSFHQNVTSPPMGMTIGEMVSWILLISRSLETIIMIIAFSFLIIGLYRMWQSHTIKT